MGGLPTRATAVHSLRLFPPLDGECMLSKFDKTETEVATTNILILLLSMYDFCSPTMELLITSTGIAHH